MRIDVSYREGPFKHMVTHWVFVDNEAGGVLRGFFSWILSFARGC